MGPTKIMQTEVLIVGAGPTGLVLALWLTRLGVRVRIVDRNAGPGETSRAFAVQARTLELYDQIGLAAEAVNRGRKLSALNVHNSGKCIARIPLGDFGASLSPFPFILILLQDRHEKLLIGALAEAGVEVERNTELVGLEDDGARVRAWLKRGEGEDEFCESYFLCGCDGAYSATRALIGAGFEGGSYEQTFYVADVRASGPMADGEVHYAMAGADLCSVFPLIGKDRLRLIGSVPEGAKMSGFAATFDDVAAQVSEATGLNILAVEWFSTYRVHHRLASQFRKGRAFLLGDACHSHSPAGNQGLNTGVADSVNLAWKLSAVLRGQADPALLDTYEAERMAVARTVVSMTDLAFDVQMNPAGAMRSIRLGLFRLAPAVFQLGWVRLMFFRTIGQLMINYRTSVLSVGRAGSVAAGDRLPWVRLAGGMDNYAPLRSIGWQAHVYGLAQDQLRRACGEWGLPLHEFTWSASAGRQGLSKDAVYLVRPDGYVAYASRDQDPKGMEALISLFNFKSFARGVGA
jgi:2-polyprenyl-6-methoxyphenol hydroxylase-like FAD-dependent oxidoreductase